MKQIRLSTLVLLVVVAALCFALMVQEKRYQQCEAELKAKSMELDRVKKYVERVRSYMSGSY